MNYSGGDYCNLETDGVLTATRVENARRVRARNRHFSLGAGAGIVADALSVGKADSVQLSESVMRWSTDECLGLWDVREVVVEDCIIAESLNDPGLHPTGGGPNGTAHGCGALYWTRLKDCQVRFNRVLFAHHNYRAMCSVAAKESGSVIADFANCVAFDTANYYYQDQGDSRRNLRGCVFLQTGYRFKASMWQSETPVYINDCICIDRDGGITDLREHVGNFTETPYPVRHMPAAEPASGLVRRLARRLLDVIPVDADDVRVLGRILSHKPGVHWTGIIDREGQSEIQF